MSIADNIREIRTKISEYATECGRTPDSVKLLAVSKTFPASDVQEAMETAEQFMFGENRVQELSEKVPVLPGSIEWHLIGHLQSNKAAKAAALASWIHSVDSEKLLSKLDNAAGCAERKLNILLEVNVSGEESKSGIRGEDDVMRIAEYALTCRNLRWMGLMTMAPAGAEESVLRKTFGDTRILRDRLQERFGIILPELSMGMSGDYGYAIQEGATIVRIGTAIFGKR